MEPKATLRDLVLPDIITADVLARAMRCSEMTARALMRRGTIPAKKLAGKWLTTRVAVLRTLTESRPEPRLMP